MASLSGFGNRLTQVLSRNSDGTPAATSTTVYSGRRTSALNFTLTWPDNEIVQYLGDDGVLGQMMLPPTSLVTGEITAEQSSLELRALLSGLTIETVGTTSTARWLAAPGNSRDGLEGQMIVVVNQQAIDTEKGSATAGNQYYKWAIVLNTKIAQKPGGFENGTKSVDSYMIVPNTTSKTWFGNSFSATNGNVTYATILTGESDYPFRIVGFLGDGATTEFLFEAGFPAAAAASTHITVFKDGVEGTVGITYATDKITYAIAPALGAKIAVGYQTSPV